MYRWSKIKTKCNIHFWQHHYAVMQMNVYIKKLDAKYPIECDPIEIVVKTITNLKYQWIG